MVERTNLLLTASKRHCEICSPPRTHEASISNRTPTSQQTGRTISAVAIALLLIATSGCAVREVIGEFFQSAYSGGGTTAAERRDHMQRSFRSAEMPMEHYDPILDR